MSTGVISSISNKDTSNDKVDVALVKLKCHGTFIGIRQLIASRNTVAERRHMRQQRIHFAPFKLPQGQLLKQAEQFEDDYDNNDYSDYIEDVSVHAVTDIRLGLRWPAYCVVRARVCFYC